VSLARDLDDRLQPGRVQAERDGVVAEVDVDDVDRLGARVRGIRMTAPRRGDVCTQASRLPEAMRPLVERIIPVEVDAGLGGAVLRTDPADIVDREFFEVRTDGMQATVQRLRGSGEGTTVRPFTLTREQLGRIVDGLDGVLRGEEER